MVKGIPITIYIAWTISVIGFIVTFILDNKRRKDIKLPDGNILRVYDNTHMFWLIIMWLCIVVMEMYKIFGGQ